MKFKAEEVRPMDQNKKQIYIVISQTGTLLSRIIKRSTGDEYCHASISLTKDMDRMYSFGRLNPYNPFIGGFVMESPRYGTFKRFKNTKAAILAVDISEEQYNQIESMLNSMWENRKKYHYNYLGLYLAAFNVSYKKMDCYYCSEFVGQLLVSSKVDGSDKLRSIVHPIDFLKIPHKQIYSGKLCDYSHSSTEAI